jgi:16S rRNA (cytosine1402-N4)-methyltransferase
MQEEVIHYLAPRSGGVYLDGTVGGGGHAAQILEASAPDGLLIGFDRDPDALRSATDRLAPYSGRVRLVQRNFAALSATLADLEVAGIDGFLLDLGVSSHQLDTGERGFSFQKDAPLDMRMDPGSGETAAGLVNGLPERELAQIIREYGEERWAVRIAAFIVQARTTAYIGSTLQLVDIIKGAIPRAKWEERLHPATRTFQALRIAVNNELESLEKGLVEGIRLLNRDGRVVVISFHSLEDRIVKHCFRRLAKGCDCPKNLPLCICSVRPQLKVLTGRPVMAGDVETVSNPRSRSARLRAARKL